VSVAQVAALAPVAVQRLDRVCEAWHGVIVAAAPTIHRMPRESGTKLIAENRRSRHDYELLERLEAGLVLTGTEVKALRAGHVQLGQAYADVRGGEAWLVGASISEYAQASRSNHITDRDRKLLLKRSEIEELTAKVREKGLTLVPTKLYFKNGKVKLELAVARGRDKGDKRRAIADRDAKRQIDRALKARR
jgi:SsrA-binding protein